MGLLDQLMSGGQDRDRFDDFARRYDQGAPHEGYDDDEVGGTYRQVDRDVDDDTYRSSARDAFERMGPQERGQFRNMVRGAARDRGYDDLDRDGDGIADDDPDSLARYTSQARRRDPDLLTSLLGGGAGATGAGGGLGGLLGSGGGAGAAAGLGGLLGGGGAGGGNPIARAALAGITTMAVRRMTSGR